MAKTTKRNTPLRRKPTKKKKSFLLVKAVFFLVILIFFTFTISHYKNAILYYFSFKTDKLVQSDKLTQARIYEIINDNSDKVVGIDVSQYQGNINWNELDSVENKKIGFVFVRASVGNDFIDSSFETNWKQAKKKKIIRGAYHYYRPNENSKLQAQNFIKTVQLKKGDLPPVLDIEKLPNNQSIDSLKIGIKRWLTIIDNHYNVKPIIYSGEKYYNSFLKEDFKEYTFWIANYNPWVNEINDNWLFWQFTEKAVIKGIKEKVDINLYNGTPKMLNYLIIPN
jgi:lysozyme